MLIAHGVLASAKKKMSFTSLEQMLLDVIALNIMLPVGLCLHTVD
jgi:hypothetical protein